MKRSSRDTHELISRDNGDPPEEFKAHKPRRFVARILWLACTWLGLAAVSWTQATLQPPSQCVGDLRRYQKCEKVPETLRYHLLEVPELTTWLVGNFTQTAASYYPSTVPENEGEVWLHRAYEHLHQSVPIEEADVVLIPAYLHLNARVLWEQKLVNGKYYVSKHPETPSTGVPYLKEQLVGLIRSRIRDPSKPHILLIPCENPETSRKIGLRTLTLGLRQDVNLYATGYERNPTISHVSSERIFPLPYVVQPESVEERPRRKDFVVYASLGGKAHDEQQWSGCDRPSMIQPLEGRDDIWVRYRANSKEAWNSTELAFQASTSDYCLIPCSGKATSRALTEAVMYGCIPVFVGSRWRGLCEEPCHPGYGWHVTENLTHFPFESRIQWDTFLELNEKEYLEDPVVALKNALRRVSPQQKKAMRREVVKAQSSFVHGHGSAYNTDEFGSVASALLDTMTDIFAKE